ncbi:urease accessory protein UreF [Pontibacter sp. BAB1700]|uniref:urease accessory protein UreF n=1 Tax=Pontibacter sp. BAB1700 TaxID=1144253 RepID=UPI00192BBD96|nr:hypothetical protein [Pontibacter sp. BAB1700]
MQPLLTLLQINDSMFPIGSFTHSYGLESYVSQGIVHNTPTAKVYANNMLRHSIYYNDAAFLQKPGPCWRRRNRCGNFRSWTK